MTSNISAVCSINEVTLPTTGTTGINVSPGSTITIALDQVQARSPCK